MSIDKFEYRANRLKKRRLRDIRRVLEHRRELLYAPKRNKELLSTLGTMLKNQSKANISGDLSEIAAKQITSSTNTSMYAARYLVASGMPGFSRYAT